MKKAIIYIICLAVAVSAASSCKSEQVPELTEDQIEITMNHPRVMFLAGEEDEIRQKMEGDEFLTSVNDEIIRQSKKFLKEEPLEYELIGRRLLSVSRKAINQIYFLAYSYRMTGDIRYADKARQVMLDVCAFPSWNPSHYLDVGEMTAAVAIAYDWLYDLLTEEERAIARESIVEKGFKTSMAEYNPNPDDYYFLIKYSNWNAVCNMGLAWGAIAVYDYYPELSRMIIARAVNSTRNYTLTEYQPDGNFPEGYTYWSYGTNFLLMLYDSIEKACGLKLNLEKDKGLMKSGDYILHMTAQDMGTFRYADCGSTKTKLEIPLFWMSAKTGDNSLLYREAERFAMLRDSGRLSKLYNVRFLPVVMFWAQKGCFENVPAPKQRLYVGQGDVPIAIMRNHWGGDDEIFLGLKAGTSYNFHAHMDVGSFSMFVGGDEWFTDLEHDGYEDIEKHGIKLSAKTEDSARWDVFRDGMYSHSQMIFADRRQDPDAYASIVSSGDRKNFVWAATELKATQHNMMESYLRGAAIVNDSYVVIKDEIVGLGEETPVRWAAMTLAQVNILDEHTAELQMNGHKLYLKAEGEGIELTTFSTKPAHDYEASNDDATLVGFTSVLPAGARTEYTVYLVPEAVYGTEKPINPIKEW